MGTIPDFRRPCENSGTVLFLPHANLPMPPTPGHPQPQSTVLDRLQNGDSPQFRRFCETWALSYFCRTRFPSESRPDGPRPNPWLSNGTCNERYRVFA